MTDNRTTEPDAANLIGQLVGPYRVIAVLDQGGMGVVYHARHVELERDVALKVARQELATDPEFIERFQREIRVAVQFHHRSLVRVLDGNLSGDRSAHAPSGTLPLSDRAPRPRGGLITS